jgi:predicted dehydrogenase
VQRGVPFLTEKPLAASDADGPARLAAAIEARRLVVAVGYHLRGLEGLDEIRSRLVPTPPSVVSGRWLGGTPDAPWWGRGDQGGGQVVEQATHLYDLGRLLAGEATVVGATATRGLARDDGADVADATAATLRYHSGAVGTFVNSRRAPMPTVDLTLIADELRITVRRTDADHPGDWEIRLADGTGERVLPPRRDPYEIQAEAFLDAVEAHDPGRVLSSYSDALRTDRLTRAVVAATGQPG